MSARQENVASAEGDKYVSAETSHDGPEPMPQPEVASDEEIVSDEETSLNEYHGFGSHARGEIRRLARTYSRTDSADTTSSGNLLKYLTHMSKVPGVSPYDDVEEALDPNSENFDSKFWVKNMRKLLDSDPEYYKPSKLGIAYRDLRAYGVAAGSDYQPTVTNALYKLAVDQLSFLNKSSDRYFDILKTMDGYFQPGELTVVLGRPGSGCSTLLKTIASHTYGFNIGKESRITYDGLSPSDIETHYRGDVIYSAESDVHFPQLSVGDTLEFAAKMRTPKNRGPVSREEYAKHMASVYMATYGLSHTRNTNVGNDFVRGVSGGERKRVSIAEASLCGANVQCWDNATRGLDAATALEFIRALKTSAAILDATPLIAIYQCSQDAYDLFDKTIVLYEGYQIYFGKASKAKEFFVNMGFECPQRQTTADYLTSLTNPEERIVRPGFENKVPRSAQEFSEYWRNSPEYAALTTKIDKHFKDVESGDVRQEYHNSHVAKQADHTQSKSPYTVSFGMQVRYIIGRNVLRIKGDPSITIFSIFGQGVMGLVLSSVFYNLSSTTGDFYYRGAAMFFSVLFNAFASLLEIMSLFESRPIVEKHKKYALYRPSADALASIVSELPTKLAMSTIFNFTFYFMVNFRREPGRFFFYWMFCGLCTLTMSHMFRSLGAVSTSLAGAMTPATVILLAMVIFTGFVIPTPSMLGWSRWIQYINPVSYVFESLMVNEFANREFTCSQFIPSGPGYDTTTSINNVCSATGSVAGDSTVQGSEYLAVAFEYYNSHKWRNMGIVIAYIVVFLFVYIGLTEWNKGAMQKGELVLYLKGSLKKVKKEAKAREASANDIENNIPNEKLELSETLDQYNKETDSSPSEKMTNQKKIFHWKNLTYSVKIKSEERVILNQIDGWVKPGQVTALMGASGAGKTTLLNCLSERLTTGVVTDGIRMVDGKPLDGSFQRTIGYVQQQDIHLPTSTVREALTFSAHLRQPKEVSIKEKDAYVDHVIDLLDMNIYADALIGVAGEGLNVEQRKRLTIAVELVAKPKLLLFLDEPTSGLDSQTAWSICKLMRKLADHGQAILCTIHQPSAMLMQEFDRLLFLQKGGRTAYFGDLGKNSQTLIDYFEGNGAHPCPKDANPAEWMLEVVGAAPGSRAAQDYFEVWRNSDEYAAVHKELEYMETELLKLPAESSAGDEASYAAPFWSQYYFVTKRALQQYWRLPGYIYSKIFLVGSSALFNGFSFFKAGTSIQGLQNQMFSIFMFFIPLNTLIQQMLPYYVKQREVYEVREAPSKTFSWAAFITAQITAEVPFQVAIGIIAFFCWYYPVGLYENAVPTDSVNERGGLMFLLITSFFVYASTLGQLVGSFSESAENAANFANLLFIMCLNFCGVLAGPDVLPGFWIFMYRCNPFTYLVQGMLSTGLAHNVVECGSREFVSFDPFLGQTCGEYMADYIELAGGYVSNPNATSNCEFCQLSSTDTFLASVNAVYSERWRNWGIFIAFIAINMIFTIFFYWLARVPKGSREKKK
ncbi:pleiotropic drug resistance protein PDR [Metschnikowia bicuspidata var. bicuspidata NRRL YB-4993]|uniref:Pleiotropic drug resistance protein PDR n=1 Tax=Metschnikowia bicuspidata var. bicuspidata NRRL YB-4993 TaxID=869754 RepID=A0A1A0HIG2_9ASCO|nr:pleiotropic drug resistance protein PDR [Metschnikowia bicuspidata var. bicuspidata NRRL YB-4993]OBA23628.1 pleiotropic drug resistance protein PDR [Metschnikowia bicuspidata var. bicuspidata NRRL YB-4993]